MPLKDPGAYAAYHRAYYAKNREKLQEYKANWARDNYDSETAVAKTRSWSERNPKKAEGVRFRARLKKYGIDFLTFSAMLICQTGRCSCCGDQFENTAHGLHVDHDHTDNKVRGLVCSDCNHVAGYARDSIPRLMKTVDYLQRFTNG